MTTVYDQTGQTVTVYDHTGRIVWGPGESTPEEPGTPTEPTTPPNLSHVPAPETQTTTPTYVGDGIVTHPSVVDFGYGRAWNGARHWLADTPYSDAVTGKAGYTENPSIWRSTNYGITWTVPPGVSNPLVPPPDNPEVYNSDVELIHDPDTDRLVLFWRAHTTFHIKAITSTNGVDWSPEQTMIAASAGTSPTVLRMKDGTWSMWLSREADGLHKYTAPTPTGPWTYVGKCTLPAGVVPWHGDFIWWGDQLIGVWGDRHGSGRAYAATDTAGMSWAVGGPLASLHGYRVTLAVSDVPSHVDSWAARSVSNVGHTYRRTHIANWTALL